MFRKYVDVHTNNEVWEALPRPTILGPARQAWAISAALHVIAVGFVAVAAGDAQQRIRERLWVEPGTKVGDVTPDPISDSTLTTVVALYPMAIIVLMALQGWLVWRIDARRSKGARSMYICAVISAEFIAIAGADVMLRGTMALPLTFAATAVAVISIALLITGKVNDWLPTDTQEMRRFGRRDNL